MSHHLHQRRGYRTLAPIATIAEIDFEMRAAKRDKNEQSIVEELRRLGCSVQALNLVDGPDLVVGYNGQNYLIEIKDSKGRVSEGQQRWHSAWAGQVTVCRTLAGVLAVIGWSKK